MEGVEHFKYLGRPLDKSDGNWMEVQKNTKWERKVWGRLGNFLQSEGADIKVSTMFYREVVQAVLLFGLEYCVLLTEMENIAEGAHTSFLRQIKGK